jgi:quinoprotein glucose dehydrogenase
MVPLLRSLIVAALPLAAVAVETVGDPVAKPGELKPANRTPEPQVAPASDEWLKQKQKFVLPPGFTAEVWAAEPLLGNPVSFDIDEKGRAFVAETYRYRTSVLDIRHYMFMLEDDLASRSTDDRIAQIKKHFPNEWQQLQIETEVVRLLEDRKGAGKADFSSAYAAGMNTLLDGINSGVLAHDGTVWSTNIPNLWRFDGTTAEGKAEKRESLSFGYGVRFSFTGHDMHGLIMGPDGRLYFSFGDRGANVTTKEGTKLAFPDEGAVFRCEPDGSHMEMFYHGLRNPQELGFDNHGNLFTGDRERWVYLVEGGDSGWRVGWQHPPLGVANNMWLTEHLWMPREPETPAWVLSPILNIPDGPSGVLHNPGTGFPAEYDDAFLVCGFKGSSAKSAIAWWKVREDGAGFAVEREPANFVDHVQSTDVAIGPDSKIYFTEWGEGWEGKGMGRIFKLTNAEVEKAQAEQIAEVKKLMNEGFKQRRSEELAKLLGHADQRIRLRAQWALAEKPDGAAVLLKAAQTGAGLARLHGIWGLGHTARLAGYQAAGQQSAMVSPLVPLLRDADAEVRAQAAKVLGESRVQAAIPQLISGLKDESLRVRFFAMQALADLRARDALASVAEFVKENAGHDQFLRHAAVNYYVHAAPPELLHHMAVNESAAVQMVSLLAMRRLHDPEVATLLYDSNPALQKEAARAIIDGGIEEANGDLAKLSAKDSSDDKFTLRVLDAAFRSANAQALAEFAADASRPEKMRAEALTQLSLWAKPPARDRITGLYRPLAKREIEPAQKALTEALPKLLDRNVPVVAAGALEAATALDARNVGPAIFEYIKAAAGPASVRAQALKVLAAFNDPKLADAVRIAAEDADSGLRIAATAMLGAFDPEKAAQQLAALFPSASVADQKSIVTSLGALKGAASDDAIAALVNEAAAGRIPVEAQLELIEAANAHAAANVQAPLAKWREAQTAADKLGKYAFALKGGNRIEGEKVFKEHAVAQCFRCHKIKGVGGDAGPDLTQVGKRADRNYILESIVDPNAKIAHGFDAVICTMTSGDIKAGLLKRETSKALILQPPIPGAPEEPVIKVDIKKREAAPSGMPPGLGDLLTYRELRDVVEFVANLK